MEVTYYDSGTASYEPARYVTGLAELYDNYAEEVISTEEADVNVDGIIALGCAGQYEEWEGEWDLNNEARDLDGPYGSFRIDDNDCGDTISTTLSTSVYERFKNFRTAVEEIDDVTNDSRSVIDYLVTAYGCGTAAKPTNCYQTAQDRVNLSSSKGYTAWTIGHEYAHSLHAESLGGLWSVTNCNLTRSAVCPVTRVRCWRVLPTTSVTSPSARRTFGPIHIGP